MFAHMMPNSAWVVPAIGETPLGLAQPLLEYVPRSPTADPALPDPAPVEWREDASGAWSATDGRIVLRVGFDPAPPPPPPADAPPPLPLRA
ncbi:MAG: hypothetical protein IRY91_09800, partial [Gemmatimonadaceae bacterium]|nr:hypothetical protein [Gemmatimonadaceae bacterium]